MTPAAENVSDGVSLQDTCHNEFTPTLESNLAAMMIS